jgi:hypothetical protein
MIYLVVAYVHVASRLDNLYYLVDYVFDYCYALGKCRTVAVIEDVGTVYELSFNRLGFVVSSELRELVVRIYYIVNVAETLYLGYSLDSESVEHVDNLSYLRLLQHGAVSAHLGV